MHLYLTGYRGSGKSTVGRLLAEQLNRPVVDTDDMVEASAGKSIRQIFEEEHEAGFRLREAAMVAQAAARTEPSVIALGGGAILSPANQRVLASSGRVVWLQGSPAQLWARIAGDSHTILRRPKLSQQNDYDEIVEVLARREPIYRQMANLIVATDLRTPDEIAAEIIDWLKSDGAIDAG